MEWKKLLKYIFLFIILPLFGTSLVLGIVGLFVAGWEGLKGGLLWGMALGAFSLPVGGYVIFAKYWGSFAGRYSAWHYKNDTEGDDKKPDY